MAKYHDTNIRHYFKDVFGYEERIAQSAGKMVEFSTGIGIDMYFDGVVYAKKIKEIDIAMLLSQDEVTGIMKEYLG